MWIRSRDRSCGATEFGYASQSVTGAFSCVATGPNSKAVPATSKGDGVTRTAGRT